MTKNKVCFFFYLSCNGRYMSCKRKCLKCIALLYRYCHKNSFNENSDVKQVKLPFSTITNLCTHSSVFIKITLKVHAKLTPTCFGSQMEPSSGGQQLIIAKVYKWFNGASPYSQYCGGIRKPMCVYC